MLARALRRRGHEVSFIVASRDRLNRPEHRYADITSAYPGWIHDLSRTLRWRWLLPFRAPIRRALSGCDFVFLNEEGPTLAGEFPAPHGVLLTGSDLQVFANPARIEGVLPPRFTRGGLPNRLMRSLIRTTILEPCFLQRQRTGIARASFISYFAPGLQPEGDALLAGLGVSSDDRRRCFLLMTDLELLKLKPRPSNQVPRLFCATRLTWKAEADAGLTAMDCKGTDVLIEGLAEAAHEHHQPFELHLVRKGRHVRETEELIQRHRLAERVVWHDELSQQEVISEYERSDIVLDQMASSFPGMAAMDAMATGRPVIANGRPEIFTRLYGRPMPVCHAVTAEDVARQVTQLLRNPDYWASVSREARAFTEKYLSSDAAAAFVESSLMERLGEPKA
jgi:glycosyltransferase involved in cell wall biosynthesis